MRLLIKLKNKIYPIYRFFLKLFIRSHEKAYVDAQGRRVRYLALRRRGSDRMVVVFSGFPMAHQMPVYNYLLLLVGQSDYNALFILDDFISKPGGGSFYLGSGGDYYAPELIGQIIEQYRNKWNIRTLVTAGGSKGGTCALMQGIPLAADYIIAGACQYYIGSYMKTGSNSYEDLVGKTGSVEELDRLMPELLKTYANSPKKPQILLHYSDREHTYREHIVDLREALQHYGYPIVLEDVADYSGHAAVGEYFPPFFMKMLRAIRDDSFPKAI